MNTLTYSILILGLVVAFLSSCASPQERIAQQTLDNFTHMADEGDYWQCPEETIARGKGDCEDYALLLSHRLTEAGYDHNLYLGRYQGEGHMMVEIDGYVFDNFGHKRSKQHYEMGVQIQDFLYQLNKYQHCEG